ncbi:thioredoxin [Candidatus Roizmanbacteria bacterium RIFCSPHIGHO2_02_FULL_37_13b]|uniref:Thioredoxin n=1 Tax=Candidatus Roizmanbacteria bacterium RIFCSPLOWO2_02_FULL_36_11 TaxID=1802071 RepID=A0A1F7JH48_9BACT|nr:MAG: thioredoxin [Candidatus Roizmanbacteria bacterium RIFCSPHIGHO2_02_FULL_37_13b]OGK54943.1 MAG: thioredoxin [Candidatus Roizmanbacteria bacterium RIFCSPLOWO2_02_FULL_36_11]
MAVITVAKDTFQTQVLDDKGVVFVDYYADWCGPCRFTSPIIDELAEDSEYKTKVKFVKIDVDQNQELAEKYNIFSIPTFIIFKAGKPVSQFAGARDKPGFVAEIKRALE